MLAQFIGRVVSLQWPAILCNFPQDICSILLGKILDMYTLDQIILDEVTLIVGDDDEAEILGLTCQLVQGIEELSFLISLDNIIAVVNDDQNFALPDGTYKVLQGVSEH